MTTSLKQVDIATDKPIVIALAMTINQHMVTTNKKLHKN